MSDKAVKTISKKIAKNPLICKLRCILYNSKYTLMENGYNEWWILFLEGFIQHYEVKHNVCSYIDLSSISLASQTVVFLLSLGQESFL